MAQREEAVIQWTVHGDAAVAASAVLTSATICQRVEFTTDGEGYESAAFRPAAAWENTFSGMDFGSLRLTLGELISS
ncbi:unnamed protein product [Heligmosomoides polygyrus]|uniref:DUF3145 family protein n=1 Tax=Heligmosomoides polygyrus TaxID=6339 RepID=A0A183GCI9_HELPZ|nr:unnamed protein product [Heligmosomoides polygyrus]